MGIETHEQLHQNLHNSARKKARSNATEEQAAKDGLKIDRFQPHAILIAPVFDSFDHETRNNVGSVITMFSFDAFLINLLPEGVNGMYIVVSGTCGTEFTYRIDGNFVSSFSVHCLFYSHHLLIPKLFLFL